MSLFELCERLQQSEFGSALLASQYAYPIVETTHVLGLGLSVGLLALIDLRLIGAFMRSSPVSELLAPLRPWMLAGFALMFASGVLLFWAEAADLYREPLFRVKLAFIAVAGANALYFEWRVGSRAQRWGQDTAIPAGARFAGWASLACWGLVIVCGRWVAYGS
jgi:hypothetical protein